MQSLNSGKTELFSHLHWNEIVLEVFKSILTGSLWPVVISYTFICKLESLTSSHVIITSIRTSVCNTIQWNRAFSPENVEKTHFNFWSTWVMLMKLGEWNSTSKIKRDHGQTILIIFKCTMYWWAFFVCIFPPWRSFLCFFLFLFPFCDQTISKYTPDRKVSK